MTLLELHGSRILSLTPDGAPITTVASLLGDIISTGATHVAIPTSRLPATFFDLRTRIAGNLIQTFVNYRIPVAIIGDISPHTTSSEPLAAWVRESNRRRDLWFVPDLNSLARRLSERPPPT